MRMQANRTVLFLGILAASAHAGPVQFDDESDKLGFERGTESWGISWGNVNGDVWPDLYNHGHRDYTRLYRNTGSGDFDDVSLEYDLQMGGWWLSLPQRDVHGAALADFDNDGDDDVLIGDENEFFLNHAESGGYFTQLLLTSPQAFAAWVPTGTWTTLESEATCAGNYVQFIDLDVDGDLDKICADADNFPESGSGAEASLVPSLANTIDTAVADFDNDLRTDFMALRGALRPNGAAMLSANDLDIWFRDGTGTVATFKSSGNVRILVDGNGGGPFQEPDVIQHNSATNYSARVRRIDFAFDAVTKLWRVTDNSGSQHYIRVHAENPLTDLAVSNLDNRDQPYPIRFGQNTAGGVTWKALPGMDTPVSCTSIVAADFDNDMDLDLYLACGAGVTNEANRYYDNNGDGSFSPVLVHGGEGPIGPGREFGVADSAAVADYDVDGYMDIAVVNGLLFYPFGHGGPDTLIRNRGNGNRWIELDLVGTTTNRNGIGAKVYVTAGGRTQLREQNGGYHRWSQNSQRLHFGLAANATVQEIRIVWPSGIVDVFRNVSANRLYAATEGGGLASVTLSGEAHTTIAPGEECGQPPYHALYGPAVHLWRDCGTNLWHLRFKSGLGRMTDNVPLVAGGSLVGDANFAFANGTNLEPADSFALTTSMQVDFSLAVRDEGTAGSKGINFNTASQRSTCLDLTSQDFEAVIVGALGKRLDPPFDLSNGLKPCDSDGDGSNNSTDSDDDNDGVPDVNDAFPLDRTEWLDSDGDGTGDNSDAFPADATEQHDDDGDGIGDNADMDADNDGLPDATELLDTGFTWTIPNVQVPTDGGNSTATINLSAQGAAIGQYVFVSALMANGDLDASNEWFSLDFNNGQFLLSQVQTEQQCAATLFPTTKPLNAIVSVIDIGSGVPGIRIKGTSSSAAGNLAECGGIGLQYRLTISAVPAYGMDEDGDNVFNLFDLDSDNDTVADVVEAGLPDLNNDYLVDEPAQQASVAPAPDTDLDGIPDFLDRESRNPVNTGIDYDIAVAGRAILDSNGDGQLGPGDAGAGIDADRDGIDDLIDADPTRRGSAIPGGNHAPVAATLAAITLVDTPVSLTLVSQRCRRGCPDLRGSGRTVQRQPERHCARPRVHAGARLYRSGPLRLRGRRRRGIQCARRGAGDRSGPGASAGQLAGRHRRRERDRQHRQLFGDAAELGQQHRELGGTVDARLHRRLQRSLPPAHGTVLEPLRGGARRRGNGSRVARRGLRVPHRQRPGDGSRKRDLAYQRPCRACG